jgi:hypothetical protein
VRLASVGGLGSGRFLLLARRTLALPAFAGTGRAVDLAFGRIALADGEVSNFGLDQMLAKISLRNKA